MKATLVFVVASAAAAFGCASTKTPTELRDARAAYTEAAQSPGASLAPAEIYDARKALQTAEAVYADQGDDRRTRDLAYVAQRKAISAHARANAAEALEQTKHAQAELQQYRENQAIALRRQLESTKGALAQSEQARESERRARVAADQRASDAFEKIAGLKTERTERGLVVTISGSVVFATGKSTLLPSAQSRLRDVAKALKDDNRPFEIIGHTDSKGSDQLNDRLSQERADAVKKFLVAQGVDDSRIRTMGMGEKQPIADNNTAEGRANNRRVEIVIPNPPGEQQQNPQQQNMQQQNMQQQNPQQQRNMPRP